jgi:hypothetical protein
MASYDSKTDTISGCEPESYQYWHEKGHQELQKNGKADTLKVWCDKLLMASVLMLCVKWNVPAAICVVGCYICYNYEEIWCDFYAKRHFKAGRLQ